MLSPSVMRFRVYMKTLTLLILHGPPCPHLRRPTNPLLCFLPRLEGRFLLLVVLAQRQIRWPSVVRRAPFQCIVPHQTSPWAWLSLTACLQLYPLDLDVEGLRWVLRWLTGLFHHSPSLPSSLPSSLRPFLLPSLSPSHPP